MEYPNDVRREAEEGVTLNVVFATKRISIGSYYHSVGSRTEYAVRVSMGDWWKEKSFSDYRQACDWVEYRARERCIKSGDIFWTFVGDEDRNGNYVDLTQSEDDFDFWGPGTKAAP